MKIRVLVIVLLLGLAGCAHQPVPQGASSDAMLGGTVESVESQTPDPAVSGFVPYPQILSYPGPF